MLKQQAIVRRRSAAAFVILLMLPLIIAAQIRPGNLIKRWGVRDGLSQGVVNSIVQDDQLLMWFATEDGLNRFDGYNFRVFRFDPDTEGSLPDNFVQHVFRDSKGLLWISSRRGLVKFDPMLERYELFQHNFANKENYAINDVSFITEGTYGNLWVAWYGSGFASFNKDSSKFTAYTPETLPSLNDEKTVALHEDRKGLLWVGLQHGGLSVFQVSQGKIVRAMPELSGADVLPSPNVHALAEDRAGNIWIGTSRGLTVYQKLQNRFYTFNLPIHQIAGLNIMSLLADNEDNLWIGTQGSGLFQLDLRQFNTRQLSDFVFLRLKNLNDVDISKRTIQSIYQDNDKNLWVGTFGDGVYFVSSAKQNFVKIQRPIYDSNNAFSYVAYYGMCYDSEGRLWLGTDGNGIFVSDSNGNTIRQYTLESTKGSLADNAILSAMRDDDGNLWFGTYAHGVFRYDRKTDRFVNYRYKDNGIHRSGGNDVRVIFQDSRKNIWVGTNRGGLCLLDEAEKSYSNPQFFDGAFQYGDVRSICEDPTGDLWVGFYGDGVFRYSDKSRKYQRFFDNSDGLKSDIVFAVNADRNGIIWIGTGGSGLARFESSTNKFQRFTEKDGLANNTVYGILFDPNDNVWISTNAGVSKLDGLNHHFQNFDISDGLQEGQFNPGSALHNQVAGFMVFGGSHGLNIFYPDQMATNMPQPDIMLTGLSLFNKPVKVNDNSDGKAVLEQVMSRTREITLSHDQNVLTFDFVGLNYSYPEKNYYAYKLEGLDDNWNFVGHERTATYRYLRPGDYVFKVKVSSNPTQWSSVPATVRVVVKPPWWMTPMAYVAYALILGSLGWAVFIVRKKQLSLRKRLKIEKSQRKHERELVRQKLSFFTEVSHEFKTPLTLMIGPLEELLASETSVTPTGRKLRMVHRNAHKLLSLINKLLDYRKIESGNVLLRVSEDNIVEFTEEIVVAFKELASHKNINLKFHSEDSHIPLWFDKEKLEMVLTNIISNSFKYIGKGNEITVSVCKQISDRYPTGRAVIRVRDNGVGIAKRHLGNVFDWFHKGEHSGTMSSGIGLALAKRLVHLHKGEIFVESTEGSGSVFSIKIPMGNDHFRPEELLPTQEQHSVNTDVVADEINTANIHDGETDTVHRKGTRTLLIIEDDEEIMQFLKEYFEREYKIATASNGREALEVAAQCHPDLIVSDIMMPEMDGIGFCREIKNNLRTSHIPVILLTARTSMSHHKEGIQTGADAYIMKPFSPEILNLTIQNLLQSREKLKQYYRNLFSQEALVPPAAERNSLDEKFLQSVFDLLKANMDKPDFNINEMCDILHMSRSLLYKKIKTLTGLSPVEYIRSLRMQEAAKLLKTRQYKVFEVVYMVGFTDLKYFRQCFAREFGHSPSDFIKQTQAP